MNENSDEFTCSNCGKIMPEPPFEGMDCTPCILDWVATEDTIRKIQNKEELN